MQPLNIAILGYGRSGSTLHADAIEKRPEFQITAVCDINDEKLDQARTRFNCRTYRDYHRMLANEDLDIVSVVTRSDQHCRMTCDCLDAGVSVLVTKPWAVDAREAERMVAHADANDKHLLPWLPARKDPLFLRLREHIRSGSIGDVFCVRHTISGFAKRYDWQTEQQYGGGYLLNWGPHIVDTGVLVTGREPKTAHAWMRQVITPGDTEDVFFADLEMDNGVHVLAERTVAVRGLPEWIVQGDHGTIIANGRDLTLHAGPPTSPEDPTNHASMQAAEPTTTQESVTGVRWGSAVDIYGEVAGTLHGNSKFPVTTADALALTRLLDTIRASSKTGQTMKTEGCSAYAVHKSQRSTA